MLCLLWIAGPTKHQIAWGKWSLVEIFTLWLQITGGMLHQNNLVAFFLIKWMHVPHISVSQLRLFDNRSHYTICFIKEHIVWKCHCWFCELLLPTWTVLQRSFKRMQNCLQTFWIDDCWNILVKGCILDFENLGQNFRSIGRRCKACLFVFWGGFQHIKIKSRSKKSSTCIFSFQLYWAL